MNRTRTMLASVVAAVLTLLLGVRAADAMDVTVANQSSRQIDGLYLSATAQSDWGPDLLDGARLAPGAIPTIHGIACTQPFVVVAEDLSGCFLYQPMTCGADATWTITNDSPRDCGH